MSATTFGLELEAAILGALVLQGEIPTQIRALLTPELFSDGRRIQARAILEASDSLGACDPVAVQEILSRHDAPLDAILDIITLTEKVPSSAHLTAHIQALRDRVVAVSCLSQGAEEFLGGEIRPVQWAIDNVWPMGNSGPIGGPEKSGKTWIAHELVLSLSTGTPFLDRHHVPRQFKVLYWEEEDSRDRTRRRGRQLLAGRNRAVPSPEHLRYLVGHGLKIDQSEGFKVLRAEIDQQRPDFVVVGNLREIHLKDENRPEMAQIRDAFRSLSREFSCAFIVIHHFRKQHEGQSKRGSQMLAGSGIWGAWAEGWIYVTPGKTDDVALLEVGSKDAAGVGRLMVQRRDVTDGEPLAVDEDGRKMWPVILSEVDRTGRADESREKILDAVRKHYRVTGQPATVKLLKAETGLSRRTIVARLPELEAAGLVQSLDLHRNTKGYLPHGVNSGI